MTWGKWLGHVIGMSMGMVVPLNQNQKINFIGEIQSYQQLLWVIKGSQVDQGQPIYLLITTYYNTP